MLESTTYNNICSLPNELSALTELAIKLLPTSTYLNASNLSFIYFIYGVISYTKVLLLENIEVTGYTLSDL